MRLSRSAVAFKSRFRLLGLPSAHSSSPRSGRYGGCYEERILEELTQITRVVPHDQLAIQWDANFEFAMLDGSLPAWFGDLRAGIVERLLRPRAVCPSDIELGYHFVTATTVVTSLLDRI